MPFLPDPPGLLDSLGLANCNTNLEVDLTPMPGYETFDYDSETEHFVLFTDPASPRAGTYDPAKLDRAKIQLEWAYRYFICNLGLQAPVDLVSGVEFKTHVYFSDLNGVLGQGGYSGRIGLDDRLLVADSLQDKLTTIPAHEFFHVLQYRSYPDGYTQWEYISEGLASLAEQMLSFGHLQASFRDSLRNSYITSPQRPATYGACILYRYLAEQLVGAAPSQGLHYSWAVDQMLEEFILREAALPSPNIREWLTSVFEHNVTPDSLVQSFDAFIDNYFAMLYAFRYVQPEQQPRLALQNGQAIIDATPNGLVLTTNATEFPFPGVMAVIGNVQTQYDPAIDKTGFLSFLSAEYHRLNIDYQSVSGIRFVKTVYDDDIRFLLVVRGQAGRVARKVILRNTDEQTVMFPTDRPEPEEMLLVAYTLGHHPFERDDDGNGQGHHFGVVMESQ